MENTSTPAPTPAPAPKEKKPRSEAQLKAFALAREKLNAKNEAKRFSRQQEAEKLEKAREVVEEKVQQAIAPTAEVKVMEKKPKPAPKPKQLEVVIPAEVEKAVEEAVAPKKPRAPRAKPEAPHEYPTVSQPPPPPANPYMAMLANRLRR